MKRFALAALALAVIIVVIPASAQTGVPVKNALVVVSAQDDAILQLMLAAGGSPSSVLKALKTTEGLLSALAPSVPTDEAARFELDAPLSPGTYNVMVFAPGFVAWSNSIAVDDSSACVKAIKALVSAFGKHPFFARPHYCAADLRACLLAAAGVDAVCERRGRKAGYEKDQRNDYQQEEH